MMSRMDVYPDRFAPEAQHPCAITGNAETVITLVVAFAIQQIECAQVIPG